MTRYVFDTNSFIILFENYYESRFPTLWKNFNELVEKQKIISVREVANEISNYNRENRLTLWIKDNPQIFHQPDDKELIYVNKIFSYKHYQSIISIKSRLRGTPVADPFLIAKAKASNAYVVTQERYKKDGAKIPNVCKFLNVECTNLEGFMEMENWTF